MKPATDAPGVNFRDPLGDPDLMEDYDYSLDEHAAVDEVRSHYDPEDFAPD